MGDLVSLTASEGRYYKLYMDGEFVSQHRAEREAAESAIDLKLQNPESEIYYIHDYKVMSGLTNQGVTLANLYDGSGDPPNSPPVITTVANISFDEGFAGSVDLTTYVSDPDGDPTTLEVTQALPQGISFAGGTSINYDGTAGPTLSLGHTLQASDGELTTESNPFSIEIVAAPPPPDPGGELDPPANNQPTYQVGDGFNDPDEFLRTTDLGWRTSDDLVRGWDWAFPPTHTATFSGCFNLQGNMDDLPSYWTAPVMIRYNLRWRDLEPSKNDFSGIDDAINDINNLPNWVDSIHLNIRGNVDSAWNNSGNPNDNSVTRPEWILDEPSTLVNGTVRDTLWDEGWDGAANNSRRHINLDLREGRVIARWIRLINEMEARGFFSNPKIHNQLLHAVSNSLGEEATGDQWDGAQSAAVRESYKQVIEAWVNAYNNAGTQRALMWLKDEPDDYVQLCEIDGGCGKRAGGTIEFWLRLKWMGKDEVGLLYDDSDFNNQNAYQKKDPNWRITRPQRAYQDQNETVGSLTAENNNAFHYRYAHLRGAQIQLDNMFIYPNARWDPRCDHWLGYQLGQEQDSDTCEAFCAFGAFWTRTSGRQGYWSGGEDVRLQNLQKWVYHREDINPTSWGTRRDYNKSSITPSNLPTNLRYGHFSKSANQIRLAVDPEWNNRSQPMVVKIVFFDNGNGTVGIEYDNTAGGRSSRTFTKTNSGQLRTATYFLPDFRSTDTDEFDPSIHLNCSDGQTQFVFFRMIKDVS